MKYNKPEIANMGDAGSVIHGLAKYCCYDFDPNTGDFTLFPAYDLDE